MKHSAIQSGCLRWYVLYSLAAGLILLVVNGLAFSGGSEVDAPLWYKLTNLGLLLGYTVSLVMMWLGTKGSIIGYLITSTGYWLASTLHRGFNLWSFCLSLGLTILFLVLWQRDRQDKHAEPTST